MCVFSEMLTGLIAFFKGKKESMNSSQASL